MVFIIAFLLQNIASWLKAKGSIFCSSAELISVIWVFVLHSRLWLVWHFCERVQNKAVTPSAPHVLIYAAHRSPPPAWAVKHIYNLHSYRTKNTNCPSFSSCIPFTLTCCYTLVCRSVADIFFDLLPHFFCVYSTISELLWLYQICLVVFH